MKPKKNTGNANAQIPPVHRSEKKSAGTGGTASGTSKSQGGSRQGNAGHQESGDERRHG